MDAAGQIFRTIDDLRTGAGDLFQSRKTVSDYPSQSHVAWHMYDIALFDLPPAPQITRLYLQDCRRLTSLSSLERFPDLETLWIYGSDKLSDLDGLQNCPALTNLTIWSSVSATITLNSLAALSGLTRLEHVIFSGKTRDGSLAHLQRLANLKTVFFSNSYIWQEIAGFEAHHPTVVFKWKGGVVLAANPEVLKCKICGAPQAMLAGKGLKLACPQCDAKYLHNHVVRYTRMVASQGARSS